MTEKTLSKAEHKKLTKELTKTRKHVWTLLDEKEKQNVLTYAQAYKDFITAAKTERESVMFLEAKAKDMGFVHLVAASKDDRLLMKNIRGKSLALIVLGKAPLTNGVRIVASHIDAPRIDLKQNPVYEDLSMVFLKTHYYGGIKKFHWVARPLSLHGVVFKQDGTQVQITIGEKADDPVVTINDLLPHLASKVQGDKKISEAVPAEKLNVLVGGYPLAAPEEAKDVVKLGILKLLHDTYGIIEEDLVSAEIEIVPAGEARDVGFDRAFVGGYGQDDRSCTYASFAALSELINTNKQPEQTSIALFMDKEEIGSDGNTGAKSRLLELILYDLSRHTQEKIEPDTALRIMAASRAISADVTAGIDPDYQDVHEKRNDALIGHGICLTKYTGSRGKSSANDAHAEYLGWIRGVWNEAKVIWQAGELGKVDEGGGGTVAKYLAWYGMDVVDAGTPLLSMHAPFEIAHKADLYMTYKAYLAFYEAK